MRRAAVQFVSAARVACINHPRATWSGLRAFTADATMSARGTRRAPASSVTTRSTRSSTRASTRASRGVATITRPKRQRGSDAAAAAVPSPTKKPRAKSPGVKKERKPTEASGKGEGKGKAKGKKAKAESKQGDSSSETYRTGDSAKCHACEDGKLRCWGFKASDMRDYHDSVWGFPCYDSQELFGQMCLQSFQAGLSWAIIHKKIDNFRRAFAGWDFHKVAAFGEDDVQRLLGDAGIVRNRLKIRAAINNAKLAAELEDSYPGGFAGWVWDTIGDMPTKERYIQRHLKSHMRSDFATKAKDRHEADGVHTTAQVEVFTKALKKHGFKFMGGTTSLSFLQAMGGVNHHKRDCFAFAEIERAFKNHDPPLRGRKRPAA